MRSPDGQGPKSFGRIASFAVDDRDWMWILDSQAKELRVFDADGGYLRTMGRAGQVPGNLSNRCGSTSARMATPA